MIRKKLDDTINQICFCSNLISDAITKIAVDNKIGPWILLPSIGVHLIKLSEAHGKDLKGMLVLSKAVSKIFDIAEKERIEYERT